MCLLRNTLFKKEFKHRTRKYAESHLGNVREYQLGMMTFPFLPLVEDPGEWREAQVLLSKVPYYQVQMQKKYSVKAEPFCENYYLKIILKRRYVQNFCS